MTNENVPTRREAQENDGQQRADRFTGGDATNLLYIGVSLPSTAYSEPQQRHAFVQRVLGRLRALSQVESAAIFGAPPAGRYGEPLRSAGEATPTKGLEVSYYAVTPDFFRVLLLPVLSGRSFTERDDAGSPGVIVLSASLARTLFPDTDPIGHRVPFPLGSQGDSWKEVVGVVLDAQSPPVRGRGELYVAYGQAPAAAIQIVVRGKSQVKGLGEKIRGEIQGIDGQVAVSEVQQ